jgi:hypothetical protein
MSILDALYRAHRRAQNRRVARIARQIQERINRAAAPHCICKPEAEEIPQAEDQAYMPVPRVYIVRCTCNRRPPAIHPKYPGRVRRFARLILSLVTYSPDMQVL